MQSFTATRNLGLGECDDWQVEKAKQDAFREAVQAAYAAYPGHESLPQDHGIDETVAPNNEGGVEVTVTVTLP